MLLQKLGISPTLHHRAGGTTSRPYLTFVPAEISEDVTIKVFTDVRSDHRPQIYHHKIIGFTEIAGETIQTLQEDRREPLQS